MIFLRYLSFFGYLEKYDMSLSVSVIFETYQLNFNQIGGASIKSFTLADVIRIKLAYHVLHKASAS